MGTSPVPWAGCTSCILDKDGCVSKRMGGEEQELWTRKKGNLGFWRRESADELVYRLSPMKQLQCR